MSPTEYAARLSRRMLAGVSMNAGFTDAGTRRNDADRTNHLTPCASGCTAEESTHLSLETNASMSSQKS